jgi:tetratricopeptide (TPR) repeat protein
MDIGSQKRTRRLVCLALALVTATVFSQVIHCDFVDYDDPDYVSENPEVSAGLTLHGIVWAFTHTFASNWHPLTWISHMVDSQLFGLNPGGHHAVNLVIHITSTLLLFLVLHQMTGRLWRSAIVAGLFALHPLHVESVAWISERKDMLSTFFLLLTVWSYARYVKSRSVSAYLQVFSFLALGLMCKPMLVTLPFLLLLLDYWPLRRVSGFGMANTSGEMKPGMLIREKIPLFGLSLVSCVITYCVQNSGGAVGSIPLTSRMANALVAYVRYLGKMLCPLNLSVIYPLPPAWHGWQIVGASILLVLVGVLVVRAGRRWPYMPVGWFWYLGTLVPVIGLVQVGRQAMADRYTYTPLIGVFVLLVWGIADWLERFKYRTAAAVVLAAATLFLCGLSSACQLRYWKNSVTLFSHAINVTTDNALAHNNLATALAASGRKNEALQEHTEALRINPEDPIIRNDFGNALAVSGQKSAALDQYAEAARLEPGNPVIQENYGTALAREGRIDEAIAHYSEAIRLRPNYVEAYNNLGAVLSGQGRLNEAISNFNTALSLDPRDAETHNNLGGALAMQNKHAEAIVHYNEALRLGLRKAQIYFNLGLSLFKLGKNDEAITRFSEAVRADPGALESRYQLGRCLFLRGQLEAAMAQFSEIIRQKPDDARAHFSLGAALVDLRQTRSGIEHLREAIRLRPNWSDPLNVLAWVLATDENEQVRNGPEAVRLAETAVEVTGRRQPLILNTLAAAYAETGRFDDAASIANRALDLARSSGQTNLAASIQAALELYKTRRPFRQSHNS